MDTYGYLYYPTFNETFPSSNVITEDDDSSGNTQFLLNYTLDAGQKYYVIVTTYSPGVNGIFTLIVRGPTSVNLTHLPSMSFSFDIVSLLRVRVSEKK